MNQNYTLEVVSGTDGLRRLQPEWDALVREAGIRHPFLDHAWIATWWDCFGTGRRLHVVVVRAGGRVRAIAPLILGPARMYGLGFRRLGLPCNEHSPRCDFIVADDAPAAYGAIWDHIAGIRRHWDVLEINQLPAGSRTPARMSGCAQEAGMRFGTWSAPGSPYLPVAGAWETYLQGRRAKHRANLRNRFRRLCRLGPVRLETVASGHGVAGALDEGFRIEAAAWKGRAGTAIVSLPEVRRFYTALAGRLCASDALRLYFLTVGGRRIAFIYSVLAGGRHYLFKQGYDPEFSRLSPSSLLVSMVLEDAFRQGLAEFDFLGTDEPWKLEWTRHVRHHQWLYVFSDSLRATVLHGLKCRMLPWLKQRRLRPAATRIQ